MKILVSWLRDFVDAPVGAEELGAMLSMRGFELAAIEPVPGELPAPDGSRPAAGQDAVLDFEITANRPDCLSVAGIAREVATAYNLPLRLPSRGAPGAFGLDPLDAAEGARFPIQVEAPDLCPRYAAAVVDVAVGPSPAWLAARLQAAGIRPISNIVDVTNYVLMDIGQPMHAFDLARLAGPELRIRRAVTGEIVTTLDGERRTLRDDMLVIADARLPQAIAGVMGGALSEVGPGTTRIVLESACFEPRSVRRTSRHLGLKTEASARFERGGDIGLPVIGLERACALFRQIGAGRAQGPIVDLYPAPRAVRTIGLRRARIARVLGRPVDAADVERFLAGLGFGLTGSAEGWDVAVPTARVDVSREIDLIEEVGRHVGYDRLPVTFPPLDSPPPPPDVRIARDRVVRRVLAAAGASEAISFAFIDEAAAGLFADAGALVPIGNPLSAQFAVMRPSLLPGLVAAVAQNWRHERPDAWLFEIGACFTTEGARRSVGIACSGAADPVDWSGRPRPADFFDVKGIVERLCQALDCAPSVRTSPGPDYLVRGRCATVSLGDTPVGVMGQLAPAVAAAAGLPRENPIYVAELDLDAIARLVPGRSLRVKPLARYPSIVRDISIVVDDALPAATVRGTIRSAGPDTLESVREFDRYQGKGVPQGRVSLSLRLTFRSSDRTLTDSDVQDAMERILDALRREHGAIQR